MEVVHEGAGPSGTNIEYEMMQDGDNEEDHAMEYTAHSIQEGGGGDGEHIYEVTMEEYGEAVDEEGDMKDASQAGFIEEDVMDDAATHEDQEEEEGNEEEQYIEDEVEGSGDEEEESGAPTELAVVEESQSELPIEANDGEESAEEVGPLESKDVNCVPIGSTSVETSIEKVPADGNVVVEGSVRVETNGAEEGKETIEATGPEAGDVKEDAQEEAIATQELKEEDDSEEINAPPAIRVTFNGQDFVLFPHSEPSTYIPAQEAEPIAAPRLEAEAHVFYESMDSLFQTLRVKESLGDFLEEGSELQISFVDLDLNLREDDIYAREVSLHDIHRIHLGYGLTSSLHLVMSESVRFISRYNELAAHVSEAVEEEVHEEDGSDGKVEEGKVETQREVVANEDHDDSSRVAEKARDDEEPDEEPQQEENAVATEDEVVHETIIEERKDHDDGSRATLQTIQTYPDGTNAIDETTFITVNETAEEGDIVEGGEQAEEDIVDYDEAYQGEQEHDEGENQEESAHVENGNAEYEEGHQEEKGEENGDEAVEGDASYEEEGGDENEAYDGAGYAEEEYDPEKEQVVEEVDVAPLQNRQKRSHVDDIDAQEGEEETKTADYEETDSKRVKID